MNTLYSVEGWEHLCTFLKLDFNLQNKQPTVNYRCNFSNDLNQMQWHVSACYREIVLYDT